LALGLAVLLCNTAAAQPPGGGGALVLNPSVREELKLDRDQVEKIQQAYGRFIQGHRDELLKLQNPSLSNEEKRRVVKKLSDEGLKAYADILKPEQLKRFKQIRLQMDGVMALTDADTEKELKLTDKQKEEIKAIADEWQKEVMEVFRSAGANREEAFKKMNTLRKEKLDVALKTLNGEQKKMWKEMTGEPFEFKAGRP
jgi:hypothetical protein